MQRATARRVVVPCGDHVGEVPLVYLDILLESLREGHDLDVVPIGAALGHALEVVFKDAVDLGLGGRREGDGCGIGAGILPLGVPTRAAPRVDRDELLVVVGVQAHVLDDAASDVGMLVLVAIHLVGQGVEETIACGQDESASAIRSQAGDVV